MVDSRAARERVLVRNGKDQGQVALKGPEVEYLLTTWAEVVRAILVRRSNGS
jgi:hypothetical protein